MNGCAPGLVLIERLKATRKWAIRMEAPGNGLLTLITHTEQFCKIGLLDMV